MATALVAHLGFRPALAAPGRSCGFAVRQPLCKPALRRLAAAQPAPPAAPLPPNQPPGQLQGAAGQSAPSAKPVSTKQLYITLILGMAVSGFILQAPAPYWVVFGMLILVALLGIPFYGP